MSSKQEAQFLQTVRLAAADAQSNFSAQSCLWIASQICNSTGPVFLFSAETHRFM